MTRYLGDTPCCKLHNTMFCAFEWSIVHCGWGDFWTTRRWKAPKYKKKLHNYSVLRQIWKKVPYLKGRPSNALTEAMHPAQEVFWSASFAKCCFSSTISVGGLQLVAIATGHAFLHEPWERRGNTRAEENIITRMICRWITEVRALVLLDYKLRK